MDAPRLIVDMGNPQAFDVGVGVCETTGEEASSSLQPVDFQWVFGTLISHWGRLGASLHTSQFNRVRSGAIMDLVRCRTLGARSVTV